MKIPPYLAAPVINGLYGLWHATLRLSEANREAHQNYTSRVFAMWHGEVFTAPYLRKELRIMTVVSRSKDGEYMARLLESTGIKTVRGSSSRGGVAALLRAAKIMREESYDACITVDGPRGPYHSIKDGVFFLALHAGAPIVPFRVFYEKPKTFASWDRFQLPLPFTRAALVFGDPYIMESTELTPEALEKERALLKQKLDAFTSPFDPLSGGGGS